MQHTFHIPVLGLGYSIDTPLKVARYGISSVVSIVDDELTERMRKYYVNANKELYIPIEKHEEDHRAKRITAYLNLLGRLISRQIQELKEESFEEGENLFMFFELLPDNSVLRKQYLKMLKETDPQQKTALQQELKSKICAGSIDVNIMSKVDKINKKKGISNGDIFTDALSALRGFANSELRSSLILSAGMNPRLFSYMETFRDFYPDESGKYGKKIILKVSDFRSAVIQAKVLAKKGLWVSEFRIESGLNCGGHAFATDGFLLGPILQEFKDKKDHMYAELFQLYVQALLQKGIDGNFQTLPQQQITVQGGVGTAEEHDFLLKAYDLSSIGWGSPFLLVPEATNVDPGTLSDLSSASESDFYLSNASPLGIPFNNFRKSSAELQRQERIRQGKPGSPCTKKYLVSNTEFTTEPICTASRKYQHLKIAQLRDENLEKAELEARIALVTEKVCLCEGLCAAVYLKDNLLKVKENPAVSICPGPNIAYFKGPYSLKQMVEHIYGRINLLQHVDRPNMFLKEFGLYVDYLKKEIEDTLDITVKKAKHFSKFYDELTNGINYYKDLIVGLNATKQMWDRDQLCRFETISNKLTSIVQPILA
jgi:hypothetical protein